MAHSSSMKAVILFCRYTSEQETERVLYRDVFEPGDLWYHSGDLLKRDAEGFYYFVDR